MYKKIISIGEKFDDWTITSVLDERKNGYVMYEVKCKCGLIKKVNGNYLRARKSKCCRLCSALEKRPKGKDSHKYKHGATLIGNEMRPTYKIWVSMKQRCRDQNCREYKNYGGRGITFDPQWNEFPIFFKDMGKKPPNLSLDRIDNNGNYTKENCRWATRKQQNNNRRDNTIFIIDGKKVTRCEIQDKLNWTRDMYRRRAEKYGVNWICDKYRSACEDFLI